MVVVEDELVEKYDVGEGEAIDGYDVCWSDTSYTERETMHKAFRYEVLKMKINCFELFNNLFI